MTYNFLISKYLSPAHLAGFDKYKYSSIDNSPLSIYITHPFWNQCVKLCPLWLAPNLMTFMGFLLLVANFFLLSFFDPHFFSTSGGGDDEESLRSLYFIPAWAWYFCAASQFLAHTLDGCDGKQARRTGSSTPLGELFDHGLDSWAALFMPLALYSVFGRSLTVSVSPLRFYFVIYGTFLQFFISHWEKYNTGVLFLPWGYDASQIGLSLVFLLTAKFGAELFISRIPPFAALHFPHACELFFHGSSFVMTVPMSLYNLHACWRKGQARRDSFYQANKPWIPLLCLFALTTAWVLGSPTDILNSQPRLVYWMMGAVFSNITCRLIVAQMSSTEAPLFNTLLIPLAILVVAIWMPNGKRMELYYLICYTIYVTVAHIHYGVMIVIQMSDHFNIHTFSLAKREDKPKDVPEGEPKEKVQ